MNFIAAGLSDVGRQREHNEDSYCILSEHRLFVVADGRVERRAVKLGDTDGNEAFVLSGLRGGDRVVLTGPAELKDGDVVEEIGQ